MMISLALMVVRILENALILLMQLMFSLSLSLSVAVYACVLMLSCTTQESFFFPPPSLELVFYDMTVFKKIHPLKLQKRMVLILNLRDRVVVQQKHVKLFQKRRRNNMSRIAQSI